ncbi:serine/threonine-protein kinase/endoribonuclease IRE1a isoform X3 [Malania oleifera]|uniref:serine/threonine-protein kinase/endoribonuclease IRE1a isoform X3 n=2 Tax=Malania oleifera TaxID=397392 RepID=UPI0025ADDD0C|nr:serine/threonine-protein kinase/endoribonuclease IRE1a isoform X3 [Malania oleifera]
MMKRHMIAPLFVLFIIIGEFSTSIGEPSSSQITDLSSLSASRDVFKSLSQPASRTLLSLKSTHDTALVAALDGTIYLVESFSGKVLWSFNSGQSIYSSYQAPVNQDTDEENASGLSSSLFFDCGDDWELYMYNKHGGEKAKLKMPIEDIIRSTPQILEDGGLMLGSKQTAVFIVDAKTGRLIKTYKSSDSPSTYPTDEEKSALDDKDIEEWADSGSIEPFPLYITRIDYSLRAFAPKSGRVLWNVTVSEIEAALFCQDTENSSGRTYLISENKLGSELEKQFNMPLPCHSKAVVYRFRGHNMLELFSRPDRFLKAPHEDKMLPVPAQNLPSQLRVDGILDSNHENKMFPMPAPTLMLPSEPNIDKKFLDFHHNNDNEVTLFQLPEKSKKHMLSEGFAAWWPFLLIVILMVIVIYSNAVGGRHEAELKQQVNNLIGTTVPSRRKRARKLGRNNGNGEGKEKGVSPKDDELWLNHNKLLDSAVDGRRIGKLFVYNTEIAKGSNGTVVLEGVYEGRPVAIKRLVRAHHDVAFKEIQNLIASDQHPNIVRWYGVEFDQDFVYLSLERCTCNLNDLIQAYSDSSQNSVLTEDHRTKAMIEYKVQLDSVKDITGDIKLWKSNGYPSPLLLKLMRDVVSGLVHLHELGIIHRDLKPQNVLISKERSLCAKLSDMGISKRLPQDMSSFSHHATGDGSSGWQAPEQLRRRRQTRAVDMFSLGSVLFFCITGGRHPFGDRVERDYNILNNKVDLFLVEYIPEAMDLFYGLLDPNPKVRPKAMEVLRHPLFWSSEVRLSFLRDTSDRIELEDREASSDILMALESIAPVALGAKWDEKMEAAFITNIGYYRRYRFDSVRDLLRVMRNKLNHYRELPKHIQEILGPVPEGFDSYFTSRFPKLLIEVYKVVYRYCREEECFHKYFESSVV